MKPRGEFMQLKKKNRTMIFLLVLMLATSGCRSKDEVVDIKEGYEDILDDYLDNGNFMMALLNMI